MSSWHLYPAFRAYIIFIFLNPAVKQCLSSRCVALLYRKSLLSLCPHSVKHALTTYMEGNDTSARQKVFSPGAKHINQYTGLQAKCTV